MSINSILSRPSLHLQQSSLPCAARRKTGRLACTRRILSQIAPGGSTHGWARGAPILLPSNYGISESVRGAWIRYTRGHNWFPHFTPPPPCSLLPFPPSPLLILHICSPLSI